MVLAIHLKREAFEHYLNQAVYSSFKSVLYENWDAWQHEVKNSSVRLQWDPDHNPYGAKLERRAILIGIRNKEIIQYAKHDFLEIEDISEFVQEQYAHVRNKNLDQLIIPAEKPYMPLDTKSRKKLMLETSSYEK